MDIRENNSVLRWLGTSEDHALTWSNNGTFIVVYRFSLVTSQPLTDDVMRVSLNHLKQEFPMLRLRVEGHDGLRCFKEMDPVPEGIDYERLQNVDVETTHRELIHKSFKMEGPLWRIRLVDSNKPQNGLEVLEPQRFCYTLLYNICHAISDGTSNIRICNRLMEFINSAINGSDIHVAPCVDLSPPLEDDVTPQDFLWSDVKQVAKRALREPEPSEWGKQYPVTDGDNKTEFINLGALDEDATKKVVEMSKNEGATVNGTVSAAIAIAMFDVLAEQDDPEYKRSRVIIGGHAVNTRRHSKNPTARGYHVFICALPITISPESRNVFWKVAKDYSEQFLDKINSEEFAKELLVAKPLMNVSEGLQKAREHPISVLDFGLSNMGDINHSFPGIYSHVEVTWMSRSTSIQYAGLPICFYVTTFRGRLLFTADYVPKLATLQQVARIGHGVLDILKKVNQL